MLNVVTEYRKGILFVRLRGKLNKDTIYKLHRKVTKKVKEGGIRNVVFNVTNLKQIDIRGINALLYNYEICKKNDGISFICGNNELINKNLKKGHVLNYIKEVSSELCAMKIIDMRVR